MPIYEFHCKECRTAFRKLTRQSQACRRPARRAEPSELSECYRSRRRRQAATASLPGAAWRRCARVAACSLEAAAAVTKDLDCQPFAKSGSMNSPLPSKFYVTTPIYYVNGLPHVGTALTTVACDVVARYHRLRGERAILITGTDENGTKIQEAAEQAGVPTFAFVDRLAEEFRRAWSDLEYPGRRLPSHDRTPAYTRRAGVLLATARMRLRVQGCL